MLDSDIIEPVLGPPEWISPMVVVPKGKDDIRICINMKYPNQAIQREHFPLPVIETLLNKLRGCKIFSKLDITSAYHHIELHPDSRVVTTFMTSKGLMRFKRLMFGINCAPEIFQRIMTQMLIGIDGVVIYIDDIVVAGENKTEHDKRLRQVLGVLKQNNATLNKEKCVISVDSLEILGYKICSSGIAPAEDKVEAIKNFRKPATREEARSFLGLVNFVGQFIHHLSSRSEPLRKFIRGEVETFGKEQETAFDDLRTELSNNVRELGFYKPEDETELYVDASPSGLGAVLTQRDKEGKSRIISFASKGLTKTERVYPQTQREALAVVWAVEKFYPYLFGIKFTIFTDHKTLEYIFEGKHQNGKRACSRAEGWALRLQPYNFVVKYIPGNCNISDSLSRLGSNWDINKPFDEASEHYVYTIDNEYEAITLSEIRSETAQDETMKKVVKAIENQTWGPNLAHYQAFSKELGIIQGMVVRDDRIVLPGKLRQKALHIAHAGHPGEVTMKRKLREKMWWPFMDREIESYVKTCSGCAAVRKMGTAEPMIRKEMPERPWQDIAVDFFTVKEFGTFLVLADYYSRFLKIVEMKNITASKTIEAIETICKDQTFPESIRCDNGPPFSSEEFRSYCKTKDIKIVHSIPYWPQMNGLVERNNRGILRTLRIAKAQNSDWRKAIEEYEHMYNTTPHSITGKAPLELLNGRPVKGLLPSLKTATDWNRDKDVKERDAIRKMKGKIYADEKRRSKPSDIEVGDIVQIWNYHQGKAEPKYGTERFRVIKRVGNDTIVVSNEGVKYRRPVAHLYKIPLVEAIKTKNSQNSKQKDGNQSVGKRPIRVRRIPNRLKD
ncbi:uncharacterized protein K02A2.6-like isoform X1 [Anopheles merus]|uniref:uncharacterized protein K02A2.6-like isoform X1 n=1 Tax=Anopheles merus TaxID=30066 RepID=UPI001BE47297|nr:uncharacterized protein K02A2.6-like isoform X1 [Anopheles merus]XP_041785954.1 uncharacterized protein K02A2.6-like isoform X1 [Anopheles merus]